MEQLAVLNETTRACLHGPETLDSMVRVLAQHAIDLVRTERRDHGLRILRMQEALDEARRNERAVRNWNTALERAVREHEDGKQILQKAKEAIDSIWSYERVDGLPF